ncbi:MULTISPECIES: hypothetical protein [Nocardia]|uniref:hypothetical protein n=1 Tax=Nocardia abscessus TaxID=120957 RepID=UPI0018956577|nr:hypothetical protein [Nocardia abscessus]MBF6476361.1 hypothetical protein [Nocardia abscessus]
MRLARTWIGVDITGTRARGDVSNGKIVIHSAMGRRQNRLIRRWTDRVNEEQKRATGTVAIDDEGRNLLTGLIADQLAPVFAHLDNGTSPGDLELVDRADTLGDLHWRAHWITAPDSYPVGLIVWLAPGPVPARPIYNSWILDLEAMTTSSAGDDLSILGTDRKIGEPRPIRDLLAYANAGDVPNFLALYWDASTAPKGTLAEAMWSIKTPSAANWVHFLSSAHSGIGPTDTTVYGLTAQLPARPEGLDLTLRQTTRFSGTSLILIDAERQVVLHASGVLRDELDTQRIGELIEQTHLTQWLDGSSSTATDTTWFEGKVSIAGREYDATAWPLPSVQQKPVRPAAIVIQAPADDIVVA